jgi:hypothetical protein
VEGIILCFKFYLKELKDRVQKPWALAGEKIIKPNIDLHSFQRTSMVLRLRDR